MASPLDVTDEAMKKALAVLTWSYGERVRNGRYPPIWDPHWTGLLNSGNPRDRVNLERLRRPELLDITMRFRLAAIGLAGHGSALLLSLSQTTGLPVAVLLQITGERLERRSQGRSDG